MTRPGFYPVIAEGLGLYWSKLALFNALHETSSRSEHLNRALDEVARRFGENAVTRGLVHTERAAPTRRLK
jgi:hypothetical protein